MKYLKLFEGKKKKSSKYDELADLIIDEYYRPKVIDNYIDNYSDEGYYYDDDNNEPLDKENLQLSSKLRKALNFVGEEILDDSNYLVDFDSIFFGVVNDKLREITENSDLVTQFFMNVVKWNLQQTIDHEEYTEELRSIIRNKLVPICIEKLMNIIDEEISDNPKKHKLLADIFEEYSGTFAIAADEFKKRFKNMDRSKKVGFFDAKLKGTE